LPIFNYIACHVTERCKKHDKVVRHLRLSLERQSPQLKSGYSFLPKKNKSTSVRRKDDAMKNQCRNQKEQVLNFKNLAANIIKKPCSKFCIIMCPVE
jgi:hypothetical protein